MQAIRGLTSLVLLLSLCKIAAADGIPAYYDPQGWQLLSENSQYAVVAQKDGRETMLLRIQLEHGVTPEKAEKLVWITPVPAPPSKVKVDILRGFPNFTGIQPVKKLGADLRTLASIMAATQIYPVVFLLLNISYMGAAEGAGDVRVYKKIHRDGVELELLGAESIEAFTAHLQSLGVELPRAGLDKLAAYTAKDSCLVVFRIADFKTYRNAVRQTGDRTYSLGVEVTFPASDGFYPLVASSGLPGDHLLVAVTVPGFARAIDPIPPGLETEYYLGEMHAGAEVHQSLGIGDSKEFRYTRFRLSGPPGSLVSDLHFKPGAPACVSMAAGYLTTGSIIRILMGLLIFILLSILSVLIVSPVWPKEARPGFRAFLILGLSNLATLIGLIFAARSLARRVGSSPKRATLFAIIVSMIFGFLLVGLTAATYQF